MQKKLIALAVAGMIAAPVAMAQSNVTIYGIVDIGFSHNSSSDTKTFKSRQGLDSGQQSGSRIGFRGTEDLGNGLKAGFVLESSMNVDRTDTLNTNRQSFLTLGGDFGTIALGRQYTPQFNMVGAFDPFATGTVGDVTYGRGVYFMGASAAPNTIRLDNLIAYVSPNFNGFNVTVGYTANGLGDEEITLRGVDSNNAKIWAINPMYRNGPIALGLNYHQVKIDGGYKDKVWDLGASYDFGVAKVSALYGNMKSDLFDTKAKQWMVGLTAPVSEAGAVQLSYSRNKIDVSGGSDPKASKWALGYTHSLSARTNLYAAYAKISTNNAAEGGFSTYSAGSADYTSGFNVGLRHRF